MYACIHVCMCMYSCIPACVYVCMFSCMYVYVCMCSCICGSPAIHSHTNTYIYAYFKQIHQTMSNHQDRLLLSIHIHTHKHAYIHTSSTTSIAPSKIIRTFCERLNDFCSCRNSDIRALYPTGISASICPNTLCKVAHARESRLQALLSSSHT